MKNYIYIIGLGLTTSAALSSCQEDMFEGLKNENLQEYTTVASIRPYSDADGGNESSRTNGSSRANVQNDGRTFYWNAADKITLWDGTTSADLTAASDYTALPVSSSVPFTGNADFDNGASVWAFYPSKNSDFMKFSLSENHTQEVSSTPLLQTTMHMLAKGTANEGKISSLEFQHLTAVFQFNITNIRPEDIKIKSIIVSSEPAVFSKTLTITPEVDNLNKEYSDIVSAISLTAGGNGFDLASGSSSAGYMNFFPTENMTAETHLTFTVNYTATVETEEVAKSTTVSGTVGELYGDKLIADGNKYVIGKRYKVNLYAQLDDEEKGYIFEEGEYIVNSADGLKNICFYEKDQFANPEMRIKLNQDASFDMNNYSWTPIEEFAGTFDGNGVVISNMTINGVDGKMTGFISNNTGTIKNIKFNNVTCNVNNKGVTQDKSSTGNGILCSINNGNIMDCELTDCTLVLEAGKSGKGSSLGGLVGINNSNVERCSLNMLTLRNVPGATIQTSTGGLIGMSNGDVKGCFVENATIIDDSNQLSNLGGLIGNTNVGNVLACHANATLQITSRNSNTGGLIGQVWHNVASNTFTIKGCYSTGEIQLVNCNGVGKTGGLIGQLTGPLKKEIVSCYTTMSWMAGKNFAAKFPISGEVNNQNAVTVKDLYYTTGDVELNPSGDGLLVETPQSKGIEEYNEELLNTMNSSLSGTGYEFQINNGANKDKQPFVIVVVE